MGWAPLGPADPPGLSPPGALLALARLLDVPPGDFLDLGLPEARRVADRRLADWLTPRPPFQPPEPAADWETVVRDAVRRELGKATQS